VDQIYETRVGDECDVPGFASDLLSVVGWTVFEDGVVEAKERVGRGDSSQGINAATHQ
jgi:hypothetical protein